MMKLKSLLVLILFLNFLALPSIAKIVKWDISIINLTISEEETPSAPNLFSEKTLPETMNLKDYLKFFEVQLGERQKIFYQELSIPSPILNILSPPPEQHS